MGTDAFCALVERALPQEAVGVEYLRAAPPAAAPAPDPSSRAVLRLLGPAPHEVERDLASSEAYVANGAACRVAKGAGR